MSYSLDPETVSNLMSQSKMKEAFLDLIRRYHQSTYPSISRAAIRKALVLFFAMGTYLYYQHKRRRCRKVYQRTERNIDIINTLLPLIKLYKPTIYLPGALVQILYGEFQRGQIIEFEKQVVILPDEGEVLLEWFPNNFSEMDAKVPIIIFNLGVCGNSKDRYYQSLCNHVAAKKWRMVLVNRRGFGFTHLKNATFIPKNETSDLDFIAKKIAEIYPQANLYMMGVSAGANHSANYLGRVREDTPIKAFIGISSPFNIGRISFTMKHNIWGSFYSKIIANNMKELYRFHYDNPHFQNIIRSHKLNLGSLEKKLDKRDTCWRVDKYITHKLGGHDTVYDYYIDISSEHVIDDIKVPCLFISNEEDPICLKENIPVEKIYKNENTILLFFERGGHIEYFSGFNRERYCYTIAMRYIEYFEKKCD